MSIFSRLFHTTPFDSMNLGELRKAESQMKYQIQKLQNEKTDLEQQIRTLFSAASSGCEEAGTSFYAKRIRAISESWQLKATTCMHLEKDLRVLSNIIAIKEQQTTLKRSGVWKKMQAIDPDTLEWWLAKASYSKEEHRALMDELSEITAEHIFQEVTASVEESYIESLITEMQMNRLTFDSVGNDFFRTLSSGLKK
ncbi:hypothetical protein [Methanocalculus sp.]|uniref:hypothetical protein n=1 Tax=Methanocalculus sp. TaxID=2004547 RepID=UPI0026022296|nr:hypothetical protein [Methanocalculus sp.]MDG6249435.1 hypothetical protein [Methanocalculus sp.]